MNAMKTLLAFLALGTCLVATQPFAQPAPSPAAQAAPTPAAQPGPSVSAPSPAGAPAPTGRSPLPAKTSQNLASQKTGLVCTMFAGNVSLAALGMRITQYSTMGLVEDCDEKHFDQLTTTSIEAQLRAVQQPMFVIRGAAHHYLMDVNLATLPKPFIRVGELMVSPVGHIDLRVRELLANKGLRQGSVVASQYTPFGLTSNIHYIWNIGRPVHRLVTPTGDRYVMFGYTNRVIKNADKDNLALIGPLLNPPVGWKYESYLLDRTLTIKTDPTNNYTLNVLFDDAYNMYIQTDD